MKMVCTKEKNWEMVDEDFKPSSFGPKFQEIITVTGTYEESDGTWYTLKEYPNYIDGTIAWFNSKYFRPINYTFGEEVCEKLEQELQPQLV